MSKVINNKYLLILGFIEGGLLRLNERIYVCYRKIETEERLLGVAKCL